MWCGWHSSDEAVHIWLVSVDADDAMLWDEEEMSETANDVISGMNHTSTIARPAWSPTRASLVLSMTSESSITDNSSITDSSATDSSISDFLLDTMDDAGNSHYQCVALRGERRQ